MNLSAQTGKQYGKVIQLFIDEKQIDYKNNTSHECCLITGTLTFLHPTALYVKWLSQCVERETERGDVFIAAP